MILRTAGADVAEQAKTGGYLGIPYSKYDCQAFVEQVLKDLGVRRPDGNPYNWRGSNAMFRQEIRWRGTIDECIQKFGCIPLGAFVFKVKFDGGEAVRGYHDALGNATHVGLYVGGTPNPVMDSQPTGGIQYRKLSIFTHVGLMSMIDYATAPEPPSDPDEENALKAVKMLRGNTCTDREYLEALKTLTKYLKEDTL